MKVGPVGRIVAGFVVFLGVSIPPGLCALTAFRNVNVVDVAGGRILPGRTVIVDGDRIQSVTSDSNVPAGTTTIDGGAAYLAPGLVNAHMHLGSTPRELPLYLAHGVTTVRSLDGTPEHVAMREQIAGGSLEGPTIYTSGPILYGEEPEWASRADVRAAARSIVRNHVEHGYDYVKVYFQLTSSQYEAILAEAGAVGLPVVGHVPWDVGLERVFDGDQLTNEHLTGYDVLLQPADSRVRDVHTAWGEVLRYQNLDGTRLAALAQQAARSGMWEVPTLVVLEVWTQPEAIAALLADEERMCLLSPETRQAWNQYNRWQIPSLEQQTPEDREKLRIAVRRRRELLEGLERAGARLALGTDGPGARFVYPGVSVHQELAAYVAAGLSNAAALRAATLNGAAALNRAGEFGEVVAGQRADLILLGSNPLADIRATEDLRGVMVRGRWYGRGALDRLLECSD